MEFAETYRKYVIESTQLSYMVNMPQKYKWVEYVAMFFTTFMTGITLIVVIICCIRFRLAVTMLFFLVIYLTYFYGLISEASGLLIEKDFMTSIMNKVKSFNRK